MNRKKMVFIASGTTESGDNYMYVWNNKPTKVDILEVLKRDMPYEFAGENGSYEDTHNAPSEANEYWTEDGKEEE